MKSKKMIDTEKTATNANVHYLKEKTFVIVSGYLFVGINYIALALFLINENRLRLLSLGIAMLFAGFAKGLSRRVCDRSKGEIIGSILIFFAFNIIIIYKYYLWWLFVVLGECLAFIVILKVLGIKNH